MNYGPNLRRGPERAFVYVIRVQANPLSSSIGKTKYEDTPVTAETGQYHQTSACGY